MTRGSRRLQKLLEKRDELIFAQMDYINFCDDRGRDLDTINIMVNDYKDRLKDENMFLRERMIEEGWYFHDFFIVDPSGIYYPYYYTMDCEPEPPEYYFRTVIFCGFLLSGFFLVVYRN